MKLDNTRYQAQAVCKPFWFRLFRCMRFFDIHCYICRKFLKILLPVKDHLFSMCTKLSEKLFYTLTFAYQGVRKVNFSESFAYVLNGLSQIP